MATLWRVCLVAALALSGLFIAGAMIFTAPGERSDLLSFYAAAMLLRENPALLYGIEAQANAQMQLVPEIMEVLPYGYPPFVAVLFLLLTWLPLRVASVVVFGLNAVALVGVLRLLERRLSLNGEALVWLLRLTCFFVGVHWTFKQAQTSLAALLLLSLYVLDARDRASVRRGMWAGLLLFKPQLAIIPWLLLFWEREWRAALSAMATAAVLFAISVLAVGWRGLEGYPAMLQEMAAGRLQGTHSLSMHSLRGLASFFFPSHWLLVYVFAIVVVISCVFYLHARGTERRATVWANTVVAILLVAPHLMYHDLAMLVLPFALILGERAVHFGWLASVVISMNLLGISFVQFPRYSAFLVVLFVATWLVAVRRKAAHDIALSV